MSKTLTQDIAAATRAAALKLRPAKGASASAAALAVSGGR